jgi:cytochrome c2
MYRFAIFAALAMALSSGAALAAEPGDPARGLSYAKKFCSKCHGVEAKDVSSPNPDAPTFKEYANRLIPAATALAIWLQSPHPTMPELVVPLDDREDVIAYIVSLKDSAAGGKQ